MAFSLRRLKLKTRMILVLGLMVPLQTGLLGLFALQHLSHSLEEQMGERALHVAKTIAATPQIITAVARQDSQTLQPIALSLARQTDALFVVIGDRRGERLAHPNPSMLGHSMADDDNDSLTPTLAHGLGQVTKALGSLGLSMRARAPIYDQAGENVIGVVSVGYLLDQIETQIGHYRNTLLLVVFAAFLASVGTAIWFANHFKQAIFGLEPEQIGRLFDELNATLESVREGIIAINAEGLVTTINAAAINTLNLPQAAEVIGKPIQQVLPESRMNEVLENGEPQFDQEAWFGDLNLIVNRLPLRRNGDIVGVVSSFRRKDELDQVSRKLTQIQHYAESLRSQAHEYSNKLHTISGLIQIGATDQALALIGQETQDHQSLIHLLVDSVPDPLLAGCLLGKYNRARELGLNLVIDPESRMADLPERLPRESLVTIVGNLLDNAFEATLKHTGPQGRIHLSMTDLGNDLIFEIEDQGPGIPDDLEAHIFEKGVSSKVEPGHGLGLHLVSSLLEILGGSITLESLVNSGSRFTVYIPKQGNNNSHSPATEATT